jgi:hypothetical protein
MKKPNLLIFSLLSVFWGAASGFAASSLEVKVSSDGNVSVTTSKGASAEVTSPDGSSTTEVASQSTFSSETGTVTPVDANNSFAGGSTSDARSEAGKAIAASSAMPGSGSGAAGDVATAAGGGDDLSATETAAGGGGAPDTQAPLAPAPVTSSPNPGLTTPV